MLTDKPPNGEAAGEHNIVPEEPMNGRVPVLQVELRHIHDALKEQTVVFREHCKQDEETRKTQALILQEQAAHRAQITTIAAGLATKANTIELDELRKALHNPWVVASVTSLSSGGILLGVLKALGVIAGGP